MAGGYVRAQISTGEIPRGATTVRFLGRLFLADELEQGIEIVLLIEKSSIVLMAGSDELGTWPIELVTATRAAGDLFDLKLGDEAFRFEPRDRLSFAYDGLQTIEDRTLRRTTGWRGRLHRIRGPRRPIGEAPLREPSPPEPAPSMAPVPPQPDRVPVRPQPNPTPTPSTQPAPVPSPGPPGPITPAEPPADADDLAPMEPDVGIPADAPAVQPADTAPTVGDQGEPEPPPLPADPFDQERYPEVTLDLRSDTTDPAEVASTALLENAPPEPPAEDHPPQKPASRVSLLDRVRRSREEHVHSYRMTTISGGLVRRVCTECRHVSIGVEPS